jgi:membrane fusion protein, multidrug efflux system
MSRVTFLGAVVIALAAIGGTACRGAGSKAPPSGSLAGAREAAPAASARLPEVVVAAPTAAALDASVEAPGSFIPFEEAGIAAEAGGPVTMVGIEEGSRVSAGEVVVKLDEVKSELGVRQAEAMLAQAKADFERSKSDLERKRTLLNDKTIPQSTYDSFKAQYDAAAAGVDAADSALALARRRLRDTSVRAPFSGIVRDKRVSVGQYVREGDTLFVLMKVDPLKLQFELPEKYADRVTVGRQVRASVIALPGQEFSGTIQTVFPSVAVQSRTIRVEARVPNPGYRLKPGFFSTVRVQLARLPGAFVVPRSALVRREGTENVFVIRGDRAELVPIQTGVEAADRLEVVSGLSSSDRVVVSGADTLKPGDRVQVKG